MGTIHTILSASFPILADAALKGAALLALAALVCLYLRRASAAVRHMVWALALAGLVALPAISKVLPQSQAPIKWQAVVNAALTAPDLALDLRYVLDGRTVIAGPRGHQASRGVVDRGTAAPRPTPVASGEPALMQTIQLKTLAVGLWALGMVVVLLPVACGWLALRRLERSAKPVTSGPMAELLPQLMLRLSLRRVVLMEAGDRTMPMAWGFRKGRILLPLGAEQWTARHREAVLLHELAHIRRGDYLAQTLTSLACALYWYNPLVWFARKQLLCERERACDDWVLNAGIEPSDYAQQLLNAASSFQVGRYRTAAIAMARPSTLEGRLLALLNAGISRKSVSRLAAMIAIAATATMCLIVASAGCDRKPAKGETQLRKPASKSNQSPRTFAPSTELNEMVTKWDAWPLAVSIDDREQILAFMKSLPMTGERLDATDQANLQELAARMLGWFSDGDYESYFQYLKKSGETVLDEAVPQIHKLMVQLQIPEEQIPADPWDQMLLLLEKLPEENRSTGAWQGLAKGESEIELFISEKTPDELFKENAGDIARVPMGTSTYGHPSMASPSIAEQREKYKKLTLADVKLFIKNRPYKDHPEGSVRACVLRYWYDREASRWRPLRMTRYGLGNEPQWVVVF